VAPARPYWKGYLRLSLVSCPIAVYTATSSTERVSFRQINKKTGNRLRQQLADDETREPVESEDNGRGYEYAKNAYLLVDDDELDAIAIESTHTIDIDSFYRATTSTSAISFASPVQVEVRSVRGVRVQRRGNVGKTAK
jgi:DNA end-binding protein Ku